MALYLGSDRVRISLGGTVYKLHIPAHERVSLTAVDGSIILDSKGRQILVLKRANATNTLAESNTHS